MSVLDKVHGGYVHNRRVRVLASHLVELLPQNASVLDVGCGDGLLDRLVLDQRPDVSIEGIDVLVRDTAAIVVHHFDGSVIPHPDKSFDVVMFVDVLHHTDDPMVLLREASRVARKAVVIKDHTRNGLLAGPTLRFMDWVGNARHGVVLPYNYWSYKQWTNAFSALGWKTEEWRKHLGAYPFPANALFGRGLHYFARLGVPPAK